MAPQIYEQRISIVLRAPFSPTIFHPSWFANRQFIRSEEAEAAEIGVVHPQVTSFRAEWLVIRVEEDRFVASTVQEAQHESLRDLVSNVLQSFPAIPLRAIGVNREIHYRVDSEDALHQLGHTLAPKDFWNGVVKKPGLLTMTIEAARPDDLRGYVRVRVEPSSKVRPGVFIEVNDHYENIQPGEPSVADLDGRRILTSQWDNSLEFSKTLAKAIIDLAEAS